MNQENEVCPTCNGKGYVPIEDMPGCTIICPDCEHEQEERADHRNEFPGRGFYEGD